MSPLMAVWVVYIIIECLAQAFLLLPGSRTIYSSLSVVAAYGYGEFMFNTSQLEVVREGTSINQNAIM